ncbi:MAG: DUF5011 domain-containing protein [Bacilli bacterium]|nr:DUF5011 domain-containing protein [Bacilli bacterium]
MEKKIIRNIKILIVVALIAAFVWFIVVSPMITFHKNEESLENAAKRYFEINKEQLPTGERVKTITLKELYNDSYLKEDFYSPYSKKSCSITNSWVKVRRENNEFKYYVYLDCGILNSKIDHDGPDIKLNGDSKITLGVDEVYKEPGVKSVVDNNDGKLDVKDVTIKGKVDTSKIGTYEIEYIAFDKLSNKTVVTREVSVVKKIKNVVKKDLGNVTNYSGNPTNNYIMLSNMIFRIFGLDDNDNVIIVADQDIANVNHSKLDKWLDYYYKHLNSDAKKMLVKSKFCNMDITDNTLDTLQCNSYTKEKNVYIPSIVEVNKAQAGDTNFMKPFTMSWVSNKKSDKEAYVTRKYFVGDAAGKSFLSYNIDDNYGVRPMMIMNGNTNILGGDGSFLNPYYFEDINIGATSSLVNERKTGEYIEDHGTLWRIIDTMDDGTTKVITVDTLGYGMDSPKIYTEAEIIKYNPNNKNNIAYYINNNLNDYVDTSNFVNHEIEVPIYKDKIIYGKEIETKKYKVKLSAPNMYEMFSAQSATEKFANSRSYWLLNTSNTKRKTGAITDIGVPVNEEMQLYDTYGFRLVAYLKKDKVIVSGEGTYYYPYIIK